MVVKPGEADGNASPSPEYKSWLEMRPAFSSCGGLPPLPRGVDEDTVVAHHQFCFQHMHELVNGQADEMALTDDVDVQDLDIPIAQKSVFTPTATSVAASLFESKDKASTVKLRVFTPKSSAGPFPLVVFYASGGFLMGSESTDEVICRQLCKLSKVVVASVVYRRKPFPAAHEDSWDAFSWLRKSTSSRLLADPAGRGLYIFGSSVGGLLASYVFIRAEDEQRENVAEPEVSGLLLRSPVLLPGPDSASEKLSRLMFTSDDVKPAEWNHYHSPLHSSGFLSRSFEYYNVPTRLTDHAYISPLLYTEEKNIKFPPVYIQVSTLDITAHHSYMFSSKLRRQSQDCKMDIYEGLPHYYWALPRLGYSSKAAVDLVKGLLWMETLGNMKKRWDPGIREIREEDLEEWCETGSRSEGAEAFSARKLCRTSGCGCFL